MRVALIDADIVAYRSAASCEPNKEKLEREPSGFAIARASDLCNRIGSAVQADQHRFFLSGSENFRKRICPDYKANRAGKPKPEWLEDVRGYLIRKWNAEICTGYEADDGIGIAATGDFIVCSIDKDLKQISGEHYNFVKGEFENVSPMAATHNFYSQMLIGDSSDNIRGVDGIGPVKAARSLAGLGPREMYDRVRELYGDDERFLRNALLFKVLRSEEEFEDIQRQTEREIATADGCTSHFKYLPGVD